MYSLSYIEEQIDNHNIKDFIVLSAKDISSDVEILSTFLDRMIEKRVRVISILDKIEMHIDLFYMRMLEKMYLMNSAVLKGNKNYASISAVKKQDSKGKKKLNVAIYCRVSTREQAMFGYSVESQKEKNLMYLELFDYDIEHIEYYIDKGKSAASLNRKEMQRMLKDIEEGKIDEVIVYKLDRLSRNVLDVYELLQMFLSCDVNLVAVMDNLDIKTANGRMVLGILAIFAQWERETVIERTNDGLLQMAAEGKYPKANCPFGYDKDDEKFLHINKKESKIVYNIFLWAKSGYTFVEISDKVKSVYSLELKPFRIKSIILEDGYFGEFAYKGLIFQDVFEAIVDKNDAIEARKMVGKRTMMYGKEQVKFYYRNKIKCSCCGEITGGIPTYKKDKRYYYYYCNRCNKRINQDRLIEMTLIDMIIKLDGKEASEEFEKVLKKVKSLENKLKNITRKYAEDLMSEESYDITMTEIENRLRKEKSKFGTTKILNGQNWKELSDEERRNLVEEVVVTLIVDLDKKKIVNAEYK